MQTVEREFMFQYSRSIDEDAKRAIARTFKNPKTDYYVIHQWEPVDRHMNAYLNSTARRWVNEFRKTWKEADNG